MKFEYGISAKSLSRWLAFERISAIQAKRGPDVGWLAITRIIDAELQAIVRATDERKQFEGAGLRGKN